MVAFRAKVDGTWQAKFPRRLRHRVTGLRPSGLPNLPFSLVLSFPPHLDLLGRFSFKDNWMKELGSEVAGGSEDSQQNQPKSITQLLSTVRLVKSEEPSGSLALEIEKGVLFGCESTNVSTGRLVKSCVPVSVERLDRDKDADENVGGQSIGLFTQLEEIDMDFRVSGLPHAVVEQVENFRVRELVKKIESHPHREALQADLQQNNVYNPFSDDSKAMIREMGNVELFELCETIPKVQCSECLLY